MNPCYLTCFQNPFPVPGAPTNSGESYIFTKCCRNISVTNRTLCRKKLLKMMLNQLLVGEVPFALWVVDHIFQRFSRLIRTAFVKGFIVSSIWKTAG